MLRLFLAYSTVRPEPSAVTSSRCLGWLFSWSLEFPMEDAIVLLLEEQDDLAWLVRVMADFH